MFDFIVDVCAELVWCGAILLIFLWILLYLA